MAVFFDIALVVALAAIACGTASAGDQPLPLIPTLPGNCGYVLGTLGRDNCSTLAAYGGIDSDAYDQLNPLALCGILEVAPLVCVGDKFASCSNIYRAVEGDTCRSIEARNYTIVGGKVNCPNPKPGTPVCVRQGPNQCDVEKLCGQKLDAGMRELLGQVPDWCTVLRECEADLKSTNGDLPSLMATLKDVTPAVEQVAGNGGHPELAEFVRLKSDSDTKKAQLKIAFIPNAGGSGQHAANFVLTKAGNGNGRRLLATASRVGQTQYPRYQYYR